MTANPISVPSGVSKDGGTNGHLQAPASQNRLAASLAHEINNPLDSLLSLLSLMEHEATFTRKGHDYLIMAQQEVHRISQVAYSMLHDSQEMKIQSKTNVPQLLRSTVDFYLPRFAGKGISVNSRYCQEGELGVFPGPLRQVFSNLLLNAAAAMPRGGRIQVRVSPAREWRGQRRRGLRVTFADNGSGIRPDNLARISEPFFTTKGERGSGLGLALVREVVDRHRGALRIRSSTRRGHRGSIFSIFLPAT
ncbi:MAG TPA: HAMP domain-containing sensor histidine kinase [Candidatus Angelobacter sp.]|nr:HAMP domain-containing sensor histidine kinase [Candidatus Angelobacter sp.]